MAVSEEDVVTTGGTTGAVLSVGGIVGIVISVLMCLFAFVFLYWRRQQKNLDPDELPDEQQGMIRIHCAQSVSIVVFLYCFVSHIPFC